MRMSYSSKSSGTILEKQESGNCTSTFKSKSTSKGQTELLHNTYYRFITNDNCK